MNRVLKTILASARARLFSTRYSAKACAKSGDFVALEPRVLYSAAPIAEAIEEPVLDSGFAGSDAAGLFPDFSVAEESQGADGPWAGDLFTDEPLADSVSELIVVDSRINDLDALLADLRSESPDADVLILQSEVDGVEQVTRVLAELNDLDSLHIVAHGSGGGIQLGRTWLAQESLAAYASEISGWGDSFSPDADLLIYGCNLAESESGEELIDSLAELCACDVAASDDVTGHRSLGGDWDLEYQTGVVEDADLFAGLAEANWMGTLDITSNLVAHYEFEENGGSTALDSTANGNDGTLLNGPTWDSGSAVGDFAIDFTGDASNSNRVVTVADDTSLDFNGDFTVAFWYNATASPGGSTRIIGSHDGSAGFSIFANGSNDVNFYIEGSSNFAIDTFTAGFETDGQWHHIAATKDSSGTQLYVDAVAGGVRAGTYGTINPSAPLTIGGESATISDFEGKVDDVRVYTRALSAVDVGELRALASTVPQSLWLTTDNDVTSSGVTGLGSWGSSEILSFSDPGVSLEPGTTAGTLASTLNLDDFADDANADLNGMHYVSQTVVIGSGANQVTLLAGDVLLTVEANESFTSTNSISVTDDEIFAFRPDAVGDYSAGTFVLVADDLQSIHGETDTWALTLVETDTLVGDTTLTAGSFLVGVEKGGPGDAEDWIEWVTLTGAGAGGTSGSSVVLIDGADIGNNDGIVGLELIESNVSIGGADLVAGQVLVALEKNETVGTNSLAVTEHDVFVLEVTQTTLGSGTAQATASLLFEGADAGFDVAAERLAGVALVAGDQPPEVVASPGTAAFTESGPAVVVDFGLTISDDSSSLESAVVQITGAFLAAEDSLNFVDQNGISGSYGSSTGILTLTGSASVANYQAALRSITYSNSSEDPDTTTRTVSFTVSDGSASGTAATRSVSVSDVNDAPTLSSFAAVIDTTNEDTEVELTLAELLAQGNEADVDGTVDGVVVKIISSGTLRIGTSAGAATAWSAGSNDTITATNRAYWTPASNANGTQTAFEVVAFDDDGAESSTNVEVTVAVLDVNDAPVTADASGTFNEDTPGSIVLSGSDPDGTVASFVLNNLPSNGGLYLDAGLTTSATTAFDYAATGGTLTVYFSPDADWSGVSGFGFAARDDDGLLDASAATATITVNAINDGPSVSTNVGLTLDEGSTFAIGNSLLNEGDVDDDGVELTYTLTRLASHGDILLSGMPLSLAGNFTQADIDLGRITYAHDGSETSADDFEFSLADGGENGSLAVTGTFNIVVTPVNDAPVAVADGFNVMEGSTHVSPGSILDNDTDAELDALTASVFSGPVNGTLSLNTDGTFVYSHDGSETTADSFTYQVDDGNGGTAMGLVAITVNAVDDTPIATADAYSVFEGGIAAESVATGVLANDTDPDSGALVATLVNGPVNGALTLNGDGSFSYSHDGSETLTDSFEYEVSDGNSTSRAIVTITVSAVNDAPVATGETFVVSEGGVVSTGASGLTANDTDAEGDVLTASLVSGPGNGTAVVNADGSFAYTHDGSESTSDTFVYRIDDGNGGMDTAIVSILVSGTNDAPIAGDDSYGLVEGGTLVSTVPGVLWNDSDAEGAPLSVSLVSGPANGSLSLNADGSFTYIHDDSETTADAFVYMVSDGVGGTATATVSLAVTPVDDPPLAATDTFESTPGQPLSILPMEGVLGNDVDIDSASLSAVVVDTTSFGTLSLNPDGSFDYVPQAGFVGTDSFTYVVDDGNSLSTPVTVFINVQAVGGLDPAGSGGDSEEADGSADDDMDEEGGETTTLPELSSPSGQGDLDRKLAARNRSDRSVSQSEGDEFVEPALVPVVGPAVLTEFVSSDRLGLRVLSGIQIAVEYFDDELEFGLDSYYQDVQLLWNNLNVIRDQIEEDSNAMAVAVGTATAVSGVATIGYLVWTLRGGYLVASLVSAVPAWRVFDPLPILEMHCQQRNDQNDASLQEMLHKADSEAHLIASGGQSES